MVIGFAIFTTCIIFIACTRSPDPQRPNDPDPPGTLQDSAALLLGRWKLIKDSSTNIGNFYFIEGGIAYTPGHGNYFGKDEDYFDFKPDGKVDIYANNNGYNYTYQLFPGNKLVIAEILLAADTATVVKLAANEAIFDWSKTSPNGGKFFRRSYLGK